MKHIYFHLREPAGGGCPHLRERGPACQGGQGLWHLLLWPQEEPTPAGPPESKGQAWTLRRGVTDAAVEEFATGAETWGSSVTSRACEAKAALTAEAPVPSRGGSTRDRTFQKECTEWARPSSPPARQPRPHLLTSHQGLWLSVWERNALSQCGRSWRPAIEETCLCHRFKIDGLFLELFNTTFPILSVSHTHYICDLRANR